MLRLLLAEAGAGPPGKGVSMTQEMAPEMETLKARLKATWMAGDYGTFAKYLEPGALEFLEELPVQAGGGRVGRCLRGRGRGRHGKRPPGGVRRQYVKHHRQAGPPPASDAFAAF